MDIEQTRRLAKDESTSPEILRQLASSNDRITRKYVAENSNTPTEVLLDMYLKFPSEVINNPVIPLSHLNALKKTKNIDIETLRKVSKNENTSPKILAQLAKNQDYETRKNVAANPNTPTEILLNMYFEFPTEVINNPVISLLLIENPDLLTRKINFDFNEIKRLTDIEIKRLGWTKDEAKDHLQKNYGKRSRLHLTDEQLLSYLNMLRETKYMDIETVLAFDFNEIKQLTDIEIKRLGWTRDEGRNHLQKTYGKRTRLHLSDEELYDFYCYLKSL